MNTQRLALPHEIEIGETDQQDWQGMPRFYAQRGGMNFAFGDTPSEALSRLWAMEIIVADCE